MSRIHNPALPHRAIILHFGGLQRTGGACRRYRQPRIREYASLVSGGGVNVVGFRAGNLVALPPRR
jgi:hypothetical protein